MNEKRCSQCSLVRPLTEFHRANNCKDGRRGDCKACACKAQRAHRKANLESVRRDDRAYYAANREAKCASKARYREENPDAVRESGARHRKAHPETRDAAQVHCRLGVLREVTAELRQRPCEICGLPPRSNARQHHIDHDHSMNGPESVRGVLCAGCNSGLGYHERGKAWGRTKCPAWQASTDAYLERHQIQLSASPDAGQ